MRHDLEYFAVRTVAGIIRLMPFWLVRWSGTALGWMFYVLDGAHRRRAYLNLSSAFPTRPPRENRALTRRVFAHFGRLLTGFLKFSSLEPEAMLRLVEWDGADRLRQAHAQGRGVLLCTGHFGFWEIQALAHSLHFGPIGVVARALDNPRLNRFLEQVRTTTGNHVIYRRGAIRRVLRTLERNQAVAFLIDQHIQSSDAVYVDFFSRPAATTSALAALALRTNAPVIPVFGLPLPGGRYRFICEHPVPPPASDEPDAIREFTQRCTDVLEMYVRRYPELWLWMHRRWRDLTPVDTAPGMFPSAEHDELAEGP